MAERVQLASQILIKVDGTKLPSKVTDHIIEVVIDQHTHLPHMFVIRLEDTGLQLLDEGLLNLAKEVEIAASKDEEGNQIIPLIKGEITALEPQFLEGMTAQLVVQGYDKSHRLFRETRSKSYLNIKDSDLAEEIAQRAGLQANADATNIVYEHLYQHNQSDLTFLTQRAWRIGYECFVEGEKLYFRKPVNSGQETTLTWGQELLTFLPRMTVSEQVKKVMVRGWDVERQKAIIGQADSGKLYPKIQEQKDGAAWAGSIRGESKLIIVDQPVLNQTEADQLAKARLDEISGAFIEAEGTALRCPNLRAGKTIKLDGLGHRMSGEYLVTQATHRYTADGFVTTFAVRGTRHGLLAEQLSRQDPLDRYPSVVSAVVTNTEDPKKWGRVKVKYPWMSDEDESDWARVVGAGAGKEAGYFVMPEVEDEVIVAFTHGDFGQPVVLGGVWHGKAEPPPEAMEASSGEKPLIRTWRSRTGHKITMYDNDDNKIVIETAGGLHILMDDNNDSIEIKAGQDVKIIAEANLELQAQRDVEISAQGNMELSSQSGMKIKTGGILDINGSLINLNS